MEIAPNPPDRAKTVPGGYGQPARCTITLTADFFDESGRCRFSDIGLDALRNERDIDVRQLDTHHAEIVPQQLCDAVAVLALLPRITAGSLQNADSLLVVARFRVGYDNINVEACTARDTVLTITKGVVNRPVSEATLTWMLALSYRVAIKDKLVRGGRWNNRYQFMGRGLGDQTLGIIGFGGIGRELARLTRSLGMRTPLVFDPDLSSAEVAANGGQSVSLDQLLTRADFVTLHCQLTPETRGLLMPRKRWSRCRNREDRKGIYRHAYSLLSRTTI
ncbi:MAG: NAD(P)-dependent oxidoreductase [Planctomycetaceae bacterium]